VVYGTGEPKVTLKIHDSGVLTRLMLDPEMAFGEAYMRGQLEIDGQLEDLLALIDANDAPMPMLVDKAFHLVSLFSRWRPLSMGRNRRDVSHHYDLGNDFYRLWLDASMTYSCAYFRNAGDDLATAQRQKVAHVLRKVKPQAGETLLDIGCGWGAVISAAADDFGMHATGITLSHEQAGWFSDARIGRTGPGSAEIQLKHYHALAEEGRTFDKIVSVGMAEHVGRHRLPGFIADVKRLLKPGGIGLIHCITNVLEEPTSPWIVKYIFPGGYIPSLSEMIHGLSHQDLVIWDVENLGPHYPLTLDEWAKNFEEHIPWVQEKYGEEFVRMWRLYLRFSAASLRCQDIYVHQILFSNGRPPEVPMSREYMYVG
jgi:cyclopropane-fatty-acyl-phospholipid synthase